MLPLITIVMPVYDVEKYVKEAFLSILNQTYKNLEIIIVDDCGNDKSMDIVQEVLIKRPKENRVKIIRHNKNQGLSVARNTAIKEASGEFIYFIDSDDVMTEDCIAKMYNTIANKNIDYIAASYEEINEVGYTNGNTKILEKTTITSNKSLIEYIFADYDRNYIVTAWNKLYRISFLRNYEIYFIPNVYYEDNIFNLHIFTSAHSYIAISDITYLYRQRKNSIMHIGNNGFIYKEIKDRAYILKYSNIYLKKYRNYENYEKIAHRNSILCYYFANIAVR